MERKAQENKKHVSVLKTRKLDRNREKKHKREERGEHWGLDVMRANIVSEAVHDERGQEGEKRH